MDKEAQIMGLKEVFENYSLELDDSGQDLLENDGFYYEYARRIYWAGYHKLPEDKPLLISVAMEDVSKDVANELIRAQREADIKHYEG